MKISAKKDDANAWFEQGNHLLAENDFHSALGAYTRALALNPLLGEAHYNCGVVHHRLGDLPAAVKHYHFAVQIIPDLAEAHFNAAHAYTDMNLLDQAVASYRRTLQLQPENAAAIYNLGNIYKTLGKDDRAVSLFEKALQKKPDYAEVWNNLGIIRRDQDQLDQAAVCFEQALTIQPNLAQAHFNLGVTWHKKSDYGRSLSCFKQALDLCPAFAPARWSLSLALPMLYNHRDDIDASRQRFKDQLDMLIRTTPLETRDQRNFALDGIASTTNFYLQYQGRNDRLLQEKYGGFAAAIMAANFPQWAIPKPMPSLPPGKKMRIGYVSSLLFGHTIGIFLLGWITQHDRDRFELYCYHVGTKTDDLTTHVRKRVDSFHHIPGNLEAAARQIDSDKLHVLVHTDVGMNPLTLQLAALRLAPIQCKGWGHPVTTGLPAMDYYLSSELMEPPDGDDHYSETLVRLPNLALAHAAPALPTTKAERTVFKIPSDRFVYLSTQSLFKYLPQHDDLYPRIAQQVPDALFVFIAHSVAEVTDFFKRRLTNAFQRFGLNAANHCHFVPKLFHADFLNLNRCADLLLDTLEWSGGKTSMEALWCGVPVITCPGTLMRARHTYAFLKRIQLEETIAADKSDYVTLAVRAARDPHFYNQIKARIKANKHLLFDDSQVIPALEGFLGKLFHQSDRRNTIGKKPSMPDEFIQHHYQQGRHLMADHQPDSALLEFEKTISWIPNYLGVQSWFQEYLLDGYRPTDYPSAFIGQLYAYMGSCLCKTGRIEDSAQYAKAALRFAPDNPMARDILSTADSTLSARQPDCGEHTENQPPTTAMDAASLLRRMSVLMLTHVTQKLKRNTHLQTPGTGLVQQTYTSLVERAGTEFAHHCPKFLCFDRSAAPDTHEKQYQENLKRFADEHGFKLQVFDYCGLQSIVRAMLDKITTPYLLFLEHDWQFQGPCIPLDRLVALFDQDLKINFIRMNKRPNIISNYDYLLAKEQAHEDVALLRTVCHSNNPAMMRLSTLKQSWLPLCIDDPLCRRMDLRGKAFGLENPLFKQHIKDVRRLGFSQAHEYWGTYIYGAYDTPPYIVHLGE